MRARLALPILLTSASIMISGLGLAFSEHVRAQDGTPPTLPRPQVRIPGGVPGGDAGGAGGAGGKLQPFRTGLEDSAVRPTPPAARVAFNLEDADLPDLVRLVSRITGRRFILPSKARSIKATIYSPGDVSAAEAYQAFLSILAMNGLTVEPSGRYLKVVESTDAIRGDQIYTPGEATPTDERFVTRMVRVEHVGAELSEVGVCGGEA